MLLLAHGLEGRLDGTKARTLREAGLDPVVPDCRGLALADRVVMLDELTRGRTDVVFVGSSYGGLAAAYLADRHPERFAGLVLLAPALQRVEPPVDDPSALMVADRIPCTIIHGRHDDIVPIVTSRDLAARCPHVQLIETDDDHLLRGSLGTMVHAVKEML